VVPGVPGVVDAGGAPHPSNKDADATSRMTMHACRNLPRTLARADMEAFRTDILQARKAIKAMKIKRTSGRMGPGPKSGPARGDRAVVAAVVVTVTLKLVAAAGVTLRVPEGTVQAAPCGTLPHVNVTLIVLVVDVPPIVVN